MLSERIALDIALFVGIFVLPWWLSGFIVVALLFYFDSYYEALFAGLFIDVLYGAFPNTVFGFPWIFTATSIAMFLVVSFLKNRMRAYV